MDNREKIDVNWYLVAFVDVLGQRKKLRDLRGLPNKADQSELNDFIHLLKNTAGTVEGLRDLFHEFFDAYNRPVLDTNKLTPEQKDLYQKSKGNPLKSHMFSDFVALSLSLRDDENKVPMSGVYSVLTSTASICLMMLASGNVIRGGIDVGIGLELKSGDIYGSALSRAYDIESKISQYPRIVFGNEFMTYIRTQSARVEDTPFDTLNKQLAQLCKKFISIDEDGFPFLDYLGDSFRQILAIDLEFEIIERAYSFVVQQWNKFKLAKNSTLAFRYMLLRDYFESRLHFWTDDIEKMRKSAQPGA